MVVPDNCLFADQAGEVFKILTEDCNLHTVLRLPNGTFTPYSPGTKTNVIFFTKGLKTELVWVYDGRSNVPHITKKDRPLTEVHFEQFETVFGPDSNGRAKRKPSDSTEDRWRCFDMEEVSRRDYKIDSLKWLKDDTLDNGHEMIEPEELATDAIAELEQALTNLRLLVERLEENNADESPLARHRS